MNIALLGYGRMGKAIETIATQRGHHIVLKVSSHQDTIDFSGVDVAIDFSLPDSAVHNISLSLKANVPVISGTTGWLEQYDDMVALCNETNGTFLYASNFSLGVNIFFEVNKTLAKLIGKFPDYTVSMEEIHHTQKLDAPSGTAITCCWSIYYNDISLQSPELIIISLCLKPIHLYTHHFLLGFRPATFIYCRVNRLWTAEYP